MGGAEFRDFLNLCDKVFFICPLMFLNSYLNMEVLDMVSGFFFLENVISGYYADLCNLLH